jgi:hypothetical protein
VAKESQDGIGVIFSFSIADLRCNLSIVVDCNRRIARRRRGVSIVPERFLYPKHSHEAMPTPSTDSESGAEWTCLSVSAELRDEISRQVTAGETYDDYLREHLPVAEE